MLGTYASTALVLVRTGYQFHGSVYFGIYCVECSEFRTPASSRSKVAKSLASTGVRDMMDRKLLSKQKIIGFILGKVLRSLNVFLVEYICSD